jgi:hypothetical protein
MSLGTGFTELMGVVVEGVRDNKKAEKHGGEKNTYGKLQVTSVRV